MATTRPKTRKSRAVVLTDSKLQSMSNQASFVDAFPPLRSLKGAQVVKTSGCNSCSQSSNAADRAAAFTRVKQGLAGMSDSQKRRLAEMLNTERVEMTYVQGGKRVQLAFNAPAS